MADTDLFIFVVVPVSTILLCLVTLYAHKRAERQVQKHTDCLAAIRIDMAIEAERSGP